MGLRLSHEWFSTLREVEETEKQTVYPFQCN